MHFWKQLDEMVDIHVREPRISLDSVVETSQWLDVSCIDYQNDHQLVEEKTQEIESLKVSLEQKNQEINQLKQKLNSAENHFLKTQNQNLKEEIEILKKENERMKHNLKPI